MAQEEVEVIDHVVHDYLRLGPQGDRGLQALHPPGRVVGKRIATANRRRELPGRRVFMELLRRVDERAFELRGLLAIAARACRSRASGT